MKFTQYLERLRPQQAQYLLMAKYGIVEPRRRADRSVYFWVDARNVPDKRVARAFVRVAQEADPSGEGVATGISLYNILGLLGQGPKVFRPRLDECLALEEIEVSVPIASYAQPFPTMVIELPEAYQNHYPMQGDSALGSLGPPTVAYKPVAVILRHDPSLPVLASMIVTDTLTELCLCGLMGDPAKDVLEEDIHARLRGGFLSNDLEMNMQARVTRVALNACLLLMNRGFRESPQTNWDLIARLKKRAQKKVRPEIQALNARDLLMVPTVYEFVQHTDVRRMVGSTSACESTATGRKVTPHWRSAHWRAQHYGHRNSLTKQVLISHVMVNRHLFGGTPSQTTVFQE